MIKLARVQADLSQEELGEMIGVSERSISEYERDNTPAWPHVEKIERATGKPRGWITNQLDPYQKVVEMAEALERIEELQQDILALLRQR